MDLPQNEEEEDYLESEEDEDEDDEVGEEEIQKKRGRKPKTRDENEPKKVPKKRGRKPKEKVYSVKEFPKSFLEENKNEMLILHLPIKSTDEQNFENQYFKNTVDYSVYDAEASKYEIHNNSILETSIEDLKRNVILSATDADESLETKYNRILEEKDDILKQQNKIVKKNLKNIMYEFINANNDKTWPETTNIYCWWCCHPFTNIPCSLPEYYIKEKFYVNGCFCSFNCAASYNFSLNDDRIWERYSLLNLMYKKLFNTKFVKINLAPPREILSIFGGYLNIDEFRENLYKNEKTFTVIKPPLISIISKIEENTMNQNANKKEIGSVINENILSKTHNTLKLKRSKPVINPNNTLQSFMDLKII